MIELPTSSEYKKNSSNAKVKRTFADPDLLIKFKESDQRKKLRQGRLLEESKKNEIIVGIQLEINQLVIDRNYLKIINNKNKNPFSEKEIKKKHQSFTKKIQKLKAIQEKIRNSTERSTIIQALRDIKAFHLSKKRSIVETIKNTIDQVKKKTGELTESAIESYQKFFREEAMQQISFG